MVLARSNDAAVEALSPGARLRFLYADVSVTARRLARGHRYPPGPARLLGRALAGIAVLGIDQAEPGELLCVSADCGGEAGGWLVEHDGSGHLRGCLHSSLFPSSPGCVEDDTAEESGGAPATPSRDPAEKTLCGPAASVKTTRFRADGSMRSQVALQSKPGTPEPVYGNLLGAALPTCLSLVATTYRGEPDRVRALAMQTLPGGSRNDFARLEKLFSDGTLADLLAFDATLPTMREVLGLPDLFTGPTRALAFGCSCSEEKAARSFASLPIAPETVTASPFKFRCHLCGREMEISARAVEEARAAARGAEGNRE